MDDQLGGSQQHAAGSWILLRRRSAARLGLSPSAVRSPTHARIGVGGLPLSPSSAGATRDSAKSMSAPHAETKMPEWLATAVQQLLAGPCPLRSSTIDKLFVEASQHRKPAVKAGEPAPAAASPMTTSAAPQMLHALRLVQSQWAHLPVPARTLDTWFLVSQLHAVAATWLTHKLDLQSAWTQEASEWMRLTHAVVAYLADQQLKYFSGTERVDLAQPVWDTVTSAPTDTAAVGSTPAKPQLPLAQVIETSNVESKEAYRVELVESEFDTMLAEDDDPPSSGSSDLVRGGRRAAFLIPRTSLVGVLVRTMWRAAADVRHEETAATVIEIARLHEVARQTGLQVLKAKAEREKLVALEKACVPSKAVPHSGELLNDDSFRDDLDEFVLGALYDPLHLDFKLTHPLHVHPLTRNPSGYGSCDATCRQRVRQEGSEEKPLWSCHACHWNCCNMCAAQALARVKEAAVRHRDTIKQRAIQEAKQKYDRANAPAPRFTGAMFGNRTNVQTSSTNSAAAATEQFDQLLTFGVRGKISSFMFALPSLSAASPQAEDESGWTAQLWLTRPGGAQATTVSATKRTDPETKVDGSAIPGNAPSSGVSGAEPSVSADAAKLISALHLDARIEPARQNAGSSGLVWASMRLVQSVAVEANRTYRLRLTRSGLLPGHLLRASSVYEVSAESKVQPVARDATLAGPWLVDVVFHATATPVLALPTPMEMAEDAPASAAWRHPDVSKLLRSDVTTVALDLVPSNAATQTPPSDIAASTVRVSDPPAPLPYLMYGTHLEPPHKSTDASAFELGQRFTCNVAGTVYAVVFFRHQWSQEREFRVNMWDCATETSLLPGSRGQLVLSSSLPRPGWCTVPLGSPIQLVAGREYAVSWGSSAGGFVHHPGLHGSSTSLPFDPWRAAQGEGSMTVQPLTPQSSGCYETAGRFPRRPFHRLYYVDVLFVPRADESRKEQQQPQAVVVPAHQQQCEASKAHATIPLRIVSSLSDLLPRATFRGVLTLEADRRQVSLRVHVLSVRRTAGGTSGSHPADAQVRVSGLVVHEGSGVAEFVGVYSAKASRLELNAHTRLAGAIPLCSYTGRLMAARPSALSADPAAGAPSPPTGVARFIGRLHGSHFIIAAHAHTLTLLCGGQYPAGVVCDACGAPRLHERLPIFHCDHPDHAHQGGWDLCATCMAKCIQAEEEVAAAAKAGVTSDGHGFTLLRAWYGTADKRRGLDVTAVVRGLLTNGGAAQRSRPAVWARNDLYGDTVPGVAKQLSLTCLLDGQWLELSAAEESQIVFPARQAAASSSAVSSDCNPPLPFGATPSMLPWRPLTLPDDADAPPRTAGLDPDDNAGVDSDGVPRDLAYVFAGSCSVSQPAASASSGGGSASLGVFRLMLDDAFEEKATRAMAIREAAEHAVPVLQPATAAATPASGTAAAGVSVLGAPVVSALSGQTAAPPVSVPRLMEQAAAGARARLEGAAVTGSNSLKTASSDAAMTNASAVTLPGSFIVRAHPKLIILSDAQELRWSGTTTTDAAHVIIRHPLPALYSKVMNDGTQMRYFEAAVREVPQTGPASADTAPAAPAIGAIGFSLTPAGADGGAFGLGSTSVLLDTQSSVFVNGVRVSTASLPLRTWVAGDVVGAAISVAGQVWFTINRKATPIVHTFRAADVAAAVGSAGMPPVRPGVYVGRLVHYRHDGALTLIVHTCTPDGGRPGVWLLRGMSDSEEFGRVPIVGEVDTQQGDVIRLTSNTADVPKGMLHVEYVGRAQSDTFAGRWFPSGLQEADWPGTFGVKFVCDLPADVAGEVALLSNDSSRIRSTPIAAYALVSFSGSDASGSATSVPVVPANSVAPESSATDVAVLRLGVNFGARALAAWAPPATDATGSGSLGSVPAVAVVSPPRFEVIPACGKEWTMRVSPDGDEITSSSLTGPQRTALMKQPLGAVDLPGSPMPHVRYYEMTVKANGARAVLSVGYMLQLSARHQHQFILWSSHGIATVKITAALQASQDVPAENRPFGARWTIGDVIGAGLDLTRGCAFFTCNGRLVGETVPFPRACATAAWLPIVKLMGAHQSLGVNLIGGTERPFKWRGNLKRTSEELPPDGRSASAQVSQVSVSVIASFLPIPELLATQRVSRAWAAAVAHPVAWRQRVLRRYLQNGGQHALAHKHHTEAGGLEILSDMERPDAMGVLHLFLQMMSKHCHHLTLPLVRLLQLSCREDLRGVVRELALHSLHLTECALTADSVAQQMAHAQRTQQRLGPLVQLAHGDPAANATHQYHFAGMRIFQSQRRTDRCLQLASMSQSDRHAQIGRLLSSQANTLTRLVLSDHSLLHQPSKDGTPSEFEGFWTMLAQAGLVHLVSFEWTGEVLCDLLVPAPDEAAAPAAAAVTFGAVPPPADALQLQRSASSGSSSTGSSSSSSSGFPSARPASPFQSFLSSLVSLRSLRFEVLPHDSDALSPVDRPDVLGDVLSAAGSGGCWAGRLEALHLGGSLELAHLPLLPRLAESGAAASMRSLILHLDQAFETITEQQLMMADGGGASASARVGAAAEDERRAWAVCADTFRELKGRFEQPKPGEEEMDAEAREEEAVRTTEAAAAAMLAASWSISSSPESRRAYLARRFADVAGRLSCQMVVSEILFRALGSLTGLRHLTVRTSGRLDSAVCALSWRHLRSLSRLEHASLPYLTAHLALIPPELTLSAVFDGELLQPPSAILSQLVGRAWPRLAAMHLEMDAGGSGVAVRPDLRELCGAAAELHTLRIAPPEVPSTTVIQRGAAQAKQPDLLTLFAGWTVDQDPVLSSSTSLLRASASLCSFSGLRSLELHSASLPRVAFTHFFPALTRLHTVRLVSCACAADVSGADVAALWRGPWRQLQTLDLSGCNRRVGLSSHAQEMHVRDLSMWPASAIERIPLSLPRLQTLNLDHCSGLSADFLRLLTLPMLTRGYVDASEPAPITAARSSSASPAADLLTPLPQLTHLNLCSPSAYPRGRLSELLVSLQADAACLPSLCRLELNLLQNGGTQRWLDEFNWQQRARELRLRRRPLLEAVDVPIAQA